MTRVGLRELKNSLGVYIRRVCAGETVIVTDRGEVVAELSPPVRTAKAGLLDLARKGEITVAQPVKDKKNAYPVMPRVLKGIRSADLLNAERGDR
jgi:antitoxin (DNA-binding transcriptional repressor) of toxin-antitoxin stability system